MWTDDVRAFARFNGEKIWMPHQTSLAGRAAPSPASRVSPEAFPAQFVIRWRPSRLIATLALSEMGEGFVAGLSRRGERGLMSASESRARQPSDWHPRRQPAGTAQLRGSRSARRSPLPSTLASESIPDGKIVRKMDGDVSMLYLVFYVSWKINGQASSIRVITNRNSYRRDKVQERKILSLSPAPLHGTIQYTLAVDIPVSCLEYQGPAVMRDLRPPEPSDKHPHPQCAFDTLSHADLVVVELLHNGCTCIL